MTDSSQIAEPPFDGDGLVLPVGDTRAIVFTKDASTDLRGVGTIDSTLNADAVVKLASTSKAVADGLRLHGQLTGRLVELHPESQQAFAAMRKITEPGGYVQGTLRDADGKIEHVVRLRPAGPAELASSTANLLGAVAAQAQLAAIHRDVLRTLDAVRQVSQFQHVELLSRVQADAEEIERLTQLFLDGGSTPQVLDSISAAAQRLRAARVELANHVHAAAMELEEAASTHSLTRAHSHLEGSQASRLGQYLQFAAAAHAASIQGEALICADLLYREDEAATSHVKSLRAQAQPHDRAIRELAERVRIAQGAIESEYKPAKKHLLRRRRPIHIPVVKKDVKLPSVQPLADATERVAYAVRNLRAERKLRKLLNPIEQPRQAVRQLLNGADQVIAVVVDQEKAGAAREDPDVIDVLPSTSGAADIANHALEAHDGEQ